MGYRSDVSVVFYTRRPEETPFASIKFWFDENYPKKAAIEGWGATVETGDDFILVTYQDVKWYQDWEHVKAVRASLDSFVECFDANDVDRAAFEMVRIGEETNDIQEERSDWSDFRLSVTRLIEFS
jgi:hypothetical protein